MLFLVVVYDVDIYLFDLNPKKNQVGILTPRFRAYDRKLVFFEICKMYAVWWYTIYVK